MNSMAEHEERKGKAMGGVISDIRPVASDPNLRHVRVDDSAVATLRAADIEALSLAVGQRWTAALARQVEETIALNKARKQAMSLLSRRGYSRAELIERLVKRQHEARVAEAIADELQRDGWLNERAYAEDVVRGTVRRGPAGRRLIQERLQRRGVAGDIAGEVTAQAASGQDDRQAALELARRRLATMAGIDPAKARRRLAGLLARRGFDDEVIAGTLRSLSLERSELADGDD
jgi:regulatory protein